MEPRSPTLDLSSLELAGAVAQLELENAFLAHLLQRVSGGQARTRAAAAAADADADAADEIGREPLLLAERQELCAVEAGAVQREIEALTAAGELERACATAAAADCRTHQAAEAQLAQVEAQLAQRTEQGAAFSRVDFEQLRIEHSQAEAALAEATAEAISLKAAVAAAQQRLADQRAALSSAAAATAALRKEAGTREGQLEVLRGEVGKAEREQGLLERECARLRQQRGGGSGGAKGSGGEHADAGTDSDGSSSGGGSSAPADGRQTIMDYMRLKQAVAEAHKAVADWQRKLEVAAGAAGTAAGGAELGRWV
ncbi:hypothetical protein COHA_005884 [Chlorella ohadii]|uniref:Cilia- and flagella-associated protein 263 n=1 Tax=Chlorella ohadii TaxID=2649997 RepID=A0AAD5DQ08_9CHLO|nr:hypothetical protein COHA_005884 [Chlorella ohadii]